MQRKIILPIVMFFLVLIILLIIYIFKNQPKFSDLKSSSYFQQTEIVPTLEHEIIKDKNCMYSASLLYAWDEIKKTIGSPIIVDPSLKDLQLFNNTRSHVNTLKSNEFKTWIELNGKRIVARAEFFKSLQFDVKMINLVNRLEFNHTKVSSFGMEKFDKEIVKLINILYYQDDDHFVIKLIPKDDEHEILLFKTALSPNSISDLVKEMNSMIDSSKKDLAEENLWRYEFKDGDKLVIPKFNFNIDHHFKNLENKEFSAKGIHYEIEIANQKIAFLLDENGAVIKSESYISVKSAMPIIPINPHPKNFIFNKPFLLMLKRIDEKNPYFAIWVANAELMMKE